MDHSEGRTGDRWGDRTGDHSEGHSEDRWGGRSVDHSEDRKGDRSEGQTEDRWGDPMEDPKGDHWEGRKEPHLAVQMGAQQAVGWAVKVSAAPTAGRRRVLLRWPAA